MVRMVDKGLEEEEDKISRNSVKAHKSFRALKKVRHGSVVHEVCGL